MQKIAIKNFGPISNAEIEIKKVVALIGDNATGKSTIIKLISTFLWIEKALFRGSEEKWFEKQNRLKTFFLPYHRIENYLNSTSDIEYYGVAYNIRYNNEKISIEPKKKHTYQLPQIMYVPAERNFLTYLRSTNDLKSEGALQDFERELFNASSSLNGALTLPIGGFEIEYSKRHEMLYVRDKDHKIKITEAASGLQSSAPLYIVSDYLSKIVQNNGHSEAMTSGSIRKFQKEINEILNNENLSEKQKQIAISALSGKFNKKAFINIVEEPEQNLFPVSQVQVVKSLIQICNSNDHNKLVISTHSPYVLTIFNNLLFAQRAVEKNGEIEAEASQIAGKEIRLKSDDFSAYAVTKDGSNGHIVKSIVDETTGMIAQNYLDTASEILGNEFNALYNLHAKSFRR
ncbi:MAG: ATP-binding protein [Prevotellaceae bacterium]|jgi:predicted ATPase|nr:ATP-binding protein [Prevotellaceae bacterium]